MLQSKCVCVCACARLCVRERQRHRERETETQRETDRDCVRKCRPECVIKQGKKSNVQHVMQPRCCGIMLIKFKADCTPTNDF